MEVLELSAPADDTKGGFGLLLAQPRIYRLNDSNTIDSVRERGKQSFGYKNPLASKEFI